MRCDLTTIDNAGRAHHDCRVWRISFLKDDAFIRAMIHFEIDSALFGMDEARRNLIAKDPQAQFALAQFGEAVKLTELARNRTATKGGH